LFLALGYIAVTGSEANFAFAEDVFKERIEWVEWGSPRFSYFFALKKVEKKMLLI
jgi:hypothetical protein